MTNEGNYFRTLIETSLDPFLTIGPDGTITDVNEATIAATGISRALSTDINETDFCVDFVVMMLPMRAERFRETELVL